MLRIALLITFSFFIGCANVPRPNTNLCIANVKLLQKRCHNLKTDYDDTGILLKSAKPLVITYPTRDAMLDDLDKNVMTDPQGLANLKAYIHDLRDAAK